MRDTEDEKVSSLPVVGPTPPSASVVIEKAIEFLRATTPREPYVSNALKRLEWWAQRGFEGLP